MNLHPIKVGSGPAGSNTEIQYNNSGAFGASASLSWDDVTKVFKAVGVIVSTGTVGNTPTSGSGTRFMWIPARAALRAGVVTGAAWDDGNIGDYSVALGSDPVASGDGAIALGIDSSASGGGAGAFGTQAIASGTNAIALGQAEATQSNAVAIGFSAEAKAPYRIYCIWF